MIFISKKIEDKQFMTSKYIRDLKLQLLSLSIKKYKTLKLQQIS